MPCVSDAHSADNGQGCESSADGTAAEYDYYGAYYDPRYSAGWQAYSDADDSAGETCYSNVQSEHDLQALDGDADAEWHAELPCHAHDAADGSYIAGDPILDGGSATRSADFEYRHAQTDYFDSSVHDDAASDEAAEMGNTVYGTGAEYVGQPHVHAGSYEQGVHDYAAGLHDGNVPERGGAPWLAAGGAGADHYAGAEYDAGQPHVKACRCRTR